MIAALVLAAAVAAAPDEPKLSLPTVSDEEAWREAGLRVALGYELQQVWGLGGAPGGIVHSALVRLGLRLDERWSLLTTLRYGVRPGLYPGLRYSIAFEPTIHFDSLSISAGVGIAGFVFAATGAGTPQPQGSTNVPLTITGTDPLLGACRGSGVLALVRADYIFIASELFAAGPSVELDAQWTGCSESLFRSDPDTGELLELRQYWEHYSANIAWVFWWR